MAGELWHRRVSVGGLVEPARAAGRNHVRGDDGEVSTGGTLEEDQKKRCLSSNCGECLVTIVEVYFGMLTAFLDDRSHSFPGLWDI